MTNDKEHLLCRRCGTNTFVDMHDGLCWSAPKGQTSCFMAFVTWLRKNNHKVDDFYYIQNGLARIDWRKSFVQVAFDQFLEKVTVPSRELHPNPNGLIAFVPSEKLSPEPRAFGLSWLPVPSDAKI